MRKNRRWRRYRQANVEAEKDKGMEEEEEEMERSQRSWVRILLMNSTLHPRQVARVHLTLSS